MQDGNLIPDVTHLQTTFDFERWKSRGVLMPYRPAGFAQVYEGFKDPDGHFVAIGTFSFSYMHGPAGGPATPQDLIDPQWRGKIVSAAPQDDDATLFLFKKYVDQCQFAPKRDPSFASNNDPLAVNGLIPVVHRRAPRPPPRASARASGGGRGRCLCTHVG